MVDFNVGNAESLGSNGYVSNSVGNLWRAQFLKRWSSTGNVPSNFFLQLHGPATALSRNSLHDLTTARHFTSFL